MSSIYDFKSSYEEMIVKYLPLVVKIVDQMNIKSSSIYDREDLISVGIFGLIEAVKRYDSQKKIPFPHYAKWRIKGAIIDELRKNGRVSRDKMKKLNQVNQARNELQQKLLREPEDQELSKYLSISLEELHQIEDQIHYLSQYSLEEILFYGEEREFQLKDVIEDATIQTPEENIMQKEIKKRLLEAIECLNEREQLILSLYYKEEFTLKEIGEILNISLSRVSQIHGKILLKLRGILKKI